MEMEVRCIGGAAVAACRAVHFADEVIGIPLMLIWIVVVQECVVPAPQHKPFSFKGQTVRVDRHFPVGSELFIDVELDADDVPCTVVGPSMLFHSQ